MYVLLRILCMSQFISDIFLIVVLYRRAVLLCCPILPTTVFAVAVVLPSCVLCILRSAGVHALDDQPVAEHHSLSIVTITDIVSIQNATVSERPTCRRASFTVDSYDHRHRLYTEHDSL